MSKAVIHIEQKSDDSGLIMQVTGYGVDLARMIGAAMISDKNFASMVKVAIQVNDSLEGNGKKPEDIVEVRTITEKEFNAS